MPGYETKSETITIADISLKIQSLKDRNQYYDPNQEAEKLGISSSMWPISGLIWPSSLVLAKIINRMDLSKLRVLEVGCGIGVASMVAAHKQADITASDYHPIVEDLLNKNTEANQMPNIKFMKDDWGQPQNNRKKFDLIIGSDLIYERNHSELLSSYVDHRLDKHGKIILIGPGRKNAGKIKGIMEKIGYCYSTTKLNHEALEKKGGYFTQYIFSREQCA